MNSANEQLRAIRTQKEQLRKEYNTRMEILDKEERDLLNQFKDTKEVI